MFFASDNSGPAHPAILAALGRENPGYRRGYGADDATARVTARLREIFEAPGAAVHLVATGTAANALALATLARPWDAVFCHADSHAEEDECGAPEFFTGGAKLVTLSGTDAKIDPEALAAALGRTGAMGVHGVQRGPLTLTQATERGALYSLAEITRLAEIAHSAGSRVHMDGARFANALVALGCTPAEMTWKAGVDALSFGGTKNGCLGVEAVILFDPSLSWEFELRRKRAGHLFSKHRYLAAQMEAYLADGLWLDLASRANAAAARLAAGLAQVPGARLLHPVEANMIFAGWPRAGHARVQAAGAAYYPWPATQAPEGPPEEELTARLVCDWSMEAGEIDRFLALLEGAAR